MTQRQPQEAGHAPRCPRCGYDLAGVVATWTDTCPVEGLCSECGLSYLWSDLLCAERQRLPWLYEHAAHWWRVDKALGTALRALAPWWFWRQVRVHRRLVPSRLLLWLPVWLAVLYAGLEACMLGSAACYTTIAPPSPPFEASPGWPWRGPGAPTRMTVDLRGVVTFTIRTGRASVPAPPPGTPPRVYVTTVGRIAVCDTTMAGMVLAPGSAGSRPIIAGGIGIDYDVLIFTAPAPPRPKSPVGATFRDAVMRPGELQRRFLNPFLVRGWHAVQRAVVLPLFFAAPAALVVLACPSEWRHTHVRAGHLLRITLYSLAPTVLIVGARTFDLATVSILGALEHYSLTSPPWVTGRVPYYAALQRALMENPKTLIAAVALWSPLFWWFALRTGLQLRRPAGLWLLVSVAGLIGMAVGLFSGAAWSVVVGIF